MNRCCGETTKNIHFEKLPVDIGLISDNDGYGLVVFYVNSAIGVFEIDYCPWCGKKLSKGDKDEF